MNTECLSETERNIRLYCARSEAPTNNSAVSSWQENERTNEEINITGMNHYSEHKERFVYYNGKTFTSWNKEKS
jgi:hypothetical protein